MQKNQSFFAPASHLYNIYDYFLSSRAKVRLSFGTAKLITKKLPSLVYIYAYLLYIPLLST